MRSLADAKLERTRAVELAAQGHSYDEIAREVGFTHRGSAHRAVLQALAERQAAAVDDLRQVELDRLDRLQRSLWPSAMGGDLAAVATLLRITDHRIRLLGLDRRRDEQDDVLRTLVLCPAEGNPGEATG